MLKKFDELNKKIISESFGYPYVSTIGHVDIFKTERFDKDVGKGSFWPQEWSKLFLKKINVKDILDEKEYMIYERPLNRVIILQVKPFGSFRHQIYFRRYFYNIKNVPHLTKTGQIRVIFEESDYK